MIRESGLDKNARKQLMSGASYLKGDINTTIPWTIEAKHQKTLSWWQSIDQAKREAEQSNYNPDNWVLAVNDPRKKPEFTDVYVVIDFWKFLELLEAKQAPKTKEPDRLLKYDMEHAKQILTKIIKKL